MPLSDLIKKVLGRSTTTLEQGAITSAERGVASKIAEGAAPVAGRNLSPHIGKMYTFDSWEKALEHLRSLPVGESHRIEHGLLDSVASTNTGTNAFEIVEMVQQQVGDDLRELSVRLGNPPPADIPPRFRIRRGIQPPGKFKRSAVGGSISFGTFFSPPKKVMSRLERQFGVPIYSELYSQTESARMKVRQFVDPRENSLGDIMKDIPNDERRLGYALALHTAEGTESEARVIAHYGLKREKVGDFRNWFDEWFNALEIGRADRWFNASVPKILQSKTLKDAYPEFETMPGPLRVFGKYIQNGRLQVYKEMPIEDVALNYIYTGAHHMFVNPVVARQRALWDPRMSSATVPAIVKRVAKNYIDDVIGESSEIDRALLESLGKVTIQVARKLKNLHQKQRQLRGYDPDWADSDDITSTEALQLGRNIFGWMFALNYSANLSYRTAAVMRQYQQTFQTTVPRYGLKWVSKAAKALLPEKAGGSPYYRELVERSGIRLEEAPWITQEGPKAIGGKIFRRADNHQRALAGVAADMKFTRDAEAYMTGKMPWEKFARRSKVSRFDPLVGREIKELMDKGNLLEARFKNMREASEETQFIYRRGNQPGMSRGVPGRIFGQYGVWPTYYGDYLNNMFFHGDLLTERVPEIARWVAVNQTMAKGLAWTLGADATSWTFLTPLGFGGGPFWQIGRDIHQAFAGYGTEKALARHRLTQPAFPEMVGVVPGAEYYPRPATQFFPPGAQGARDILQMLESDSPSELIRNLLGYPELKQR